MTELSEAMKAMTDLIARLREIPVWMVRDMAPGWQEHGTTAYEAADEISALRERVEALEGALREIAVNDPLDPWGIARAILAQKGGEVG